MRELRRNNIAVRGHNLVWPSWGYLPKEAPSLKSNPPALARLVDDHIREEMTALKGLCEEWDVMNEPYDNHDLMDVMGDQAMVDWFKLVHSIDPRPRLFLNDNGIMESNGEDVGHMVGYEKTIRFLLDHGAPLGGIGMEGHYGQILTPPVRLLGFLDRFGKFGLPIQTTEFDIDTNDEQLQADYLRDYMTVTFSHPAVSGFVLWGFWAGDHWIPHAALFRRDWSIKPNGRVYEDLVFHKWWTNVQGQTDARGQYATRGFLGDYQISATANGKTVTVKTKLPKTGRTLRLILQ